MSLVRNPFRRWLRSVSLAAAVVVSALAAAPVRAQVPSLYAYPSCFIPGSSQHRLTMSARNTSNTALMNPIFQVCGPVTADGEGITWSQTVDQDGGNPALATVGFLRTLSSLPRPDCIRASAPGQAWAPGQTLTVSFHYGMSNPPAGLTASFEYVVYTSGSSPPEKTLDVSACAEKPDFSISKYAEVVDGNLVGYKIYVRNVGSVNSEGEVRVEDVVPDKLEVTRATWGRTNSGGHGTLANTNHVLWKSSLTFEPRDLLVITLATRPKPGQSGEITNTATVCGGGDPEAPCSAPLRSPQVKTTLPKQVGPVPGSDFSCLTNQIRITCEAKPQTPPQATTSAAGVSYSWSLSDEPSVLSIAGPTLAHTFSAQGKHIVSLTAFANGTRSTTSKQLTIGAPPPACTPDATTLCLLGGRFRVQADWQALQNKTNGFGQTRSLTADTGAFWFFGAANLELIVKVIDGRALNGKFWVFYGALSDVQYQIKVTDTQTGQVEEYVNDPGNLASVADTAAFPIAGASTAAVVDEDGHDSESDTTAAVEPLSACGADPTTKKLCLSERFDVTVTCSAPGRACTPNPVKLTDDTGYFWFFNDQNIELMTKVVDGRGLNGKFWFFYGALSDVQYQIQVKDRVTGNTKTYTNPQGQLSSVADTNALPGQ